VWAFVAQGERAVSFLGKRLRSEGYSAERKRIGKLIELLDADTFEERESAQERLRKLGAPCVLALRAALRRRPPLEAARRIKELLAEIGPPGVLVPPGAPLRAFRAVQALEYLGTPAARAVLRRLATCRFPDRTSDEARRALERLASGERTP
jgi:hypothetical protein